MNKEKRPLDEVEPIELDVWYLGHRDEETIVTNIMAALQDDVANIVISPSKQRREREQPSTGMREALESQTLKEIASLCDISIFYCDKYLQLGHTEFNSFKQSLTTIKAKALSIPPENECKWSDSDVKKFLEDYRVANMDCYLNPVIWFDKLNDEK